MNRDNLAPPPDLATIRAKLGRPLRVLHIGNIANNAYNNARIQRHYGIEADVISYHYDHIMACPEWEDGRFTGDVDANLPNWFATSLRGWSRPDWFVQGPTPACLQYLKARQLGLSRLARLLWIDLEARYWMKVDDAAVERGEDTPTMPLRLARAHEFAGHLGLDPPVVAMAAVRAVTGSAPSEITQATTEDTTVTEAAATVEQLPEAMPPIAAARRTWRRETVFVKAYRAFLIGAVRRRLEAGDTGALSVRIWSAIRRLRGLPPATADVPPPDGTSATTPRELIRDWLGLASDLGIGLRAAGRYVYRTWPIIVATIIRNGTIGINRHGSAAALLRQRVAEGDKAVASPERIALYLARRDALIAEARTVEPALEQPVRDYSDHNALAFADVLRGYDIVQGYSIDGFIPWVNGYTRFASYEHGTIRELPWEASLVGVVCKRVYEESPLVFVTNSDVLPSVDRLGIPPSRVTYLPHAFDDVKLRNFRATHPELAPPTDEVVFFSPTRHHWRDENRSWCKRNDIFLQAAGRLAAAGAKFRIVLVEWGKEVAASRELIDSLGLSDRVTWVPTMRKQELWARYCTSHAVVDQFALPALGGTGFETLALGRRLITTLDEDACGRFFGASPPCLVADTLESCAIRMEVVLNDPLDTAGIGAAAAAWIENYHSAERIVSLQATAYLKLLETTTPADWESP